MFRGGALVLKDCGRLGLCPAVRGCSEVANVEWGLLGSLAGCVGGGSIHGCLRLGVVWGEDERERRVADGINFRVFFFLFFYLFCFFVKCKIIGCWVMDWVDPVRNGLGRLGRLGIFGLVA